MKQYIDSCGPGVIVALDNRAFVILSAPSTPTTTSSRSSSSSNEQRVISYELLAPPPTHTNTTNASTTNGKSKKKSKRKLGATNEESVVVETKEDDTGDTTPKTTTAAAAAAADDETTKDKTNSSTTINNDNESKFSLKYQQDTNSIQAVACRWIPNSSILYCAISRFDKSISIYTISSDAEADATTTNDGVTDVPTQTTTTDSIITSSIPGLVTLKPTVVHKVPKRSCTLAFATVPPSSSSSSTALSSSTSSPMLIIIAGDLAGDASAFPVVESSTPTVNNNDSNTTTSATKPTQSPKRLRRLLLGHTASMLTSIKVLPTPQTKSNNNDDGDNSRTSIIGGGKILTADRDEKVRISSFPNTFHIEGYLLGHSAYITDMDLVGSSTNPCCVTSSGDGTVRLWDINDRVELCRINYLAHCPATDDNDDDDDDDDEPMPSSTDPKPKDEVDPSGATTTNTTTTTPPDVEDIDHAPVRVSVNGDGTILAVMRDGIDSIDLFAIAVGVCNDDDDDDDDEEEHTTLTGTLTKIRSIECPSRPLGMVFMPDGSLSILTREPTFILRFEALSSLPNEAIDTNSNTNTSTSTSTTISTHPQRPESCTITQALQTIGTNLSINMPYTLLETNEVTGKVKLRKNIQEEKVGFVKYEPWLSVERVEKAKQRTIRNKRRKRERSRLLGP